MTNTITNNTTNAGSNNTETNNQTEQPQEERTRFEEQIIQQLKELLKKQEAEIISLRSELERERSEKKFMVIEVILHIYDVKPAETINKITKDFINAGGIFHTAVEVCGKEWSYGATEEEDKTGVYSFTPKRNPYFVYRQSKRLGTTTLTKAEIDQKIKDLQIKWDGYSYHLVNRNCCHFCNELCLELGVDVLPEWVNRFANATFEVQKASEQVTKVASETATKVKDAAFSSWGTLAEYFNTAVNDVNGFIDFSSVELGDD